MKKLQPSLILLSCHSLDDFPVYHKGDEAASLLACWTALWHPMLLVATDSIPSWNRIDDPPEDCRDRVMVAPQFNQSDLPTGFAARVKEEGGRLLKGTPDRELLLSQAVEFIESTTDCPDRWVGDFLALGYAYLQVQLLTRHMRYSSNLDEIHFGQQAVNAAKAALDGDDERVTELLQRCFDILTEEREHFYPVDALLMDMVLLPPESDASSLEPQLESTHAINLHCSGKDLSKWANDATVGSALCQRIESGQWHLLGGESIEARTNLLGQETLLGNLKLGRAQFRQAVNAVPEVFARRRFGLSWAYPQLLKRLGYQGAIHATLDDGRFPEGLHLKTTWEGSDEAAIDTYAKIPFDASLPETYLMLAIKIGEMLDSDHAAGGCLVHWPGKPCPWYEDLIRINHYCGALGRFVGFKEFFKEINDPGIADRFQADQYRTPFLQQSVVSRQDNPLSRSVDYWSELHRANAASGLELLADLTQGAVQAPGEEPQAAADLAAVDEWGGENGQAVQAREAVAARLNVATTRIKEGLGGSGSGQGWLIVNPFSAVRRAGIRLPASTPLPAAKRPVYAADRTGDTTYVVVDVPAMGYVWLPASGKDASVKTGPALGQEYMLRNEFFETTIDRQSGGLRTFHEYNIRGNRLSQQLALRLPADHVEQGHGYTLMQADSIETTLANMACAEILCKGRLVHPEGERVAATFEQVFRVWRGTRILDIDITLSPEETLRADPWNSYFCQRLVWRDQAADIYRDVNQIRSFGGNKRLEAGQFVELEMEPKLTTLFTGGLPFHRRADLNYLDTLLSVRGESATQFKLGLGLDVPNPVSAAMVFGSELNLIEDVPCPANGPSGWLFHLDARSVIATNWESLGSEGEPPQGFRVRLLETMGTPLKAKLSAVQEPTSARTVDFDGNELETCEIVDGRVEIMLNANEFVEVEVRWAK